MHFLFAYINYLALLFVRFCFFFFFFCVLGSPTGCPLADSTSYSMNRTMNIHPKVLDVYYFLKYPLDST
jgi:hypothetical protein